MSCQSMDKKTWRKRIHICRRKRMIKHNKRIMRRYLRRLQFRRMMNIKKMRRLERRQKAISKRETAKLNRTLKRRRKK